MNPSRYIHIYIAKQCREDAKTFNLLEQLEKFRCRVERDQNLMLFEVFEFPYQIRKYFAYQYRLVTHIADVPYQGKLYRILTFLKIYHRGDKSYEKWYINARQHGNFIYKQRNIDQEIQELLPTLAKQNLQCDENTQDYKHLLATYNVDLLNLSQQIKEYYDETPTWRYELAPNLTANKQESTLNTILSNTVEEKNSILNFDNQHIISTLPPFKQYEPFIYHQQIQCAMQHHPHWLGLEHEKNSDYNRKIPLEFTLDETLWKLSQKTKLPFQLNDFQQQCIEKLFNHYQVYPFVAQAGQNVGKTTLLALLYAHFYFKQGINSTLPCLFLCEEHEVESLRQDIKAYIQLTQQWLSLEQTQKISLDSLLQQSCVSLKQYLLNHLDDEQKKRFPEENYIDEFRFIQLYQKTFNSQTNHQNSELEKHAVLAWNIIQYCIKGKNSDEEALKWQHEWVTGQEFQLIYDKVWKNWYALLTQKQHTQNQNFWDLQDLITYIDQQEINLTPYSALLCDQSHLFSEIALSVILKQNIWLKQGYLDSIQQIPLIFMYLPHPNEYFNPWKNHLYRILQDMLQMNQSELSRPLEPIVPFHYQAQQTAITAVFQPHYQQLNLTKREQTTTAQFESITAIKVYAVAPEQELMLPLLQQHYIPWVIDDGIHPTHSNLYQQRLNFALSKLPVKHNAVILANFEGLLSDYLHEQTHFTQLTAIQRYRLECLLHYLETALQQSIDEIYLICSNEQEINLWQAFFQHPAIEFKSLNREMLLPYSNVHALKPVEEQFDILYYLEQLKHYREIDLTILTAKVQYFKQYFRFDDASDFTAILYYAQGKIDEFFKEFFTHRYRYKMISLLIVLHRLDYLLTYKALIPTSMNLHLQCLELIYQTPCSKAWFKQYLNVLEKMLDTNAYMHSQHILWYYFWQEIHTKLYEKFISSDEWIEPEYHIEYYQAIYQAMLPLVQQQKIYSLLVWASLHFKLALYSQAVQLWDTAVQQNIIADYPCEYHHAYVQTLMDLNQRLDYIFKFDSTFIIQELLAMNLNELPNDVWKKILSHLHEDDDLELVLKHLLPSIDNQQTLDRLYYFVKDVNRESDAFTLRVQRFKTLHACLTSDWFVIEDRLEKNTVTVTPDELRHNVMLQWQNANSNNKARTKTKVKPPYSFNEETIDILYALNLNPAFYVVNTPEEWKKYQENDRIQRVFELLTGIFALKKDDDIAWRTSFNSIRALCCLMEKSPNLELPLSLYMQILAENTPKDFLFNFAIQRIAVVLTRIQLFETDDEELAEQIQRVNTKFKKALQEIKVEELELEPPILKQTSELMASILAISPQENAILQQMEREEKAEQARLEAERLAKELAEQAEKERIARELAEQERLAREQAEQERLAKALAEQQRLAEEQAEKERIAQELAEQERLAREQAEQERLAKELAEQQRLAEERAEQERLAKELAEQQRLAEEQAEQQRIAEQNAKPVEEIVETVQTSSITPTMLFTTTALPKSEFASRKATTEFVVFGVRIFMSRVHKRLNIEDIDTGERWSLNVQTGQIQSDWHYQQQQGYYHLPDVRLNVYVTQEYVHIQQLDQGVSVQIQL